MHSNNYSLEVLVNGRPVAEYYKDGKSFVEARENTEYSLRFRNNSWKRVLAIFSVDGVDVLKGKVASLAENGYVVDAYSSIDIKGYRIDDKTVAAFKFSRGPQSYAVIVGGQTNEPEGDPALGVFKHDKTDRNNGVIGVRVFEEDVPDHNYASTYKKTMVTPCYSGRTTLSNANLSPFRQYNDAEVVSLYSSDFTGCSGYLVFSESDDIAIANGECGNPSAAMLHAGEYVIKANTVNLYNLSCTGMGVSSVSRARAIAPNFDLGSTWGEKMEDKVREVKFKRAATSTDIVIYYASRESLATWGIDFSNVKQVFSWPEAFADRKSYCKVPPGYKA